MQRRRQIRSALDVVQLAVGDQNGAGKPGTGLLRHHLGERRHQKRATIGLGIRDARHAQLGIAQPRNAGLDRRQRLCRLVGPVGQALACAFVDHRNHDICQKIAVFRLKRRVQDRQNERPYRQCPQPPAGQAAPDRKRQKRGGKARYGPENRHRHQRVEDHRSVHHCPNLSRSAGTWT